MQWTHVWSRPLLVIELFALMRVALIELFALLLIFCRDGMFHLSTLALLHRCFVWLQSRVWPRIVPLLEAIATPLSDEQLLAKNTA